MRGGAGDPDLAADITVFFIKFDLVADFRGRYRGFESCQTGTDNHDTFRSVCFDNFSFRFIAGPGISRAEYRQSVKNLVRTPLRTSHAGTDFIDPPFKGLLGPVGIGDQHPAQIHQIRAPITENFFR